MSQYGLLQSHLEAQTASSVSMSYGEIERILRRPLPASARGPTRRQWWANTDTHSQAKAWLNVGRKARLDVSNEVVTFYRPERPSAAPVASTEIRFDGERLNTAARRLIDDVAEEQGVSAAQAVIALLNEAALRRRKEALNWFASNTLTSAQTSAELIRTDRDAR